MFQPQKFGEGIHSTDESTLTEDVQTMQIDRHMKLLRQCRAQLALRVSGRRLHPLQHPLHFTAICVWLQQHFSTATKGGSEIEVSSMKDFAKSAALYKKRL